MVPQNRFIDTLTSLIVIIISKKRLFLSLMGLSYELIDVDLMSGAHKKKIGLETKVLAINLFLSFIVG